MRGPASFWCHLSRDIRATLQATRRAYHLIGSFVDTGRENAVQLRCTALFVRSTRTLVCAVVTLDGLGHLSEIVIVRSGGTDILEEFRDLVIGGLVGFGGGVLDGLAGSLQFS